MKKETPKMPVGKINAESIKNALKSKEKRKEIFKSLKEMAQAVKGVTDTMYIE